jgi:hypothetical protein
MKNADPVVLDMKSNCYGYAPTLIQEIVKKLIADGIIKKKQQTAAENSMGQLLDGCLIEQWTVEDVINHTAEDVEPCSKDRARDVLARVADNYRQGGAAMT